jgi:hypothetical protein
MAARPCAITGRASGRWSSARRAGGLSPTADGAIVAEVLQIIRDLDGNPLEGQTHGLKDKTVGHVFRFQAGKVARFDIQDVPQNVSQTQPR